MKEVGAAGQAILRRSRVLVVGAGGLGSPVLQYLAGAGIGCLGIVDADRLDAGNLHRQPLYALADTGKLKVELARAAVQAINPQVVVECHPVRFSGDNALDLVGRYDLVVDCSDNFRTKFLVNDAAVITQRPAVFASVYQYEGQLQVYKPRDSHACLRCLWPDATPDGLVGNCAETGVLGPVPGAFGALQGLLTLKILLAMPGQLEGQLLLYDFMNFSSMNLNARRRAECPAPSCALIREIAGENADIDIELSSLASAHARNLEIIDIRTAEELAARPVIGRHIEMSRLLADPQQLSLARQYVLVCASGKRSLATARSLRQLGFSVQSLVGGLQSVDAPEINPEDRIHASRE